MIDKVDISRQSKIKVVWNTYSHLYTKDIEKQIINAFSKKYNIPKTSIKVEPKVKVVDEQGNEISVKTEVIDNIHDPNFQKKLFQEFIRINNIENIDFNQINIIDDEINESIDYNQYAKFNKITVKWIEVKNFLSFGPELTRLDLTELSGLVLIAGEPANQAGKSVLTGDAIRYLLYGKTNRTNSQDTIFNRFLKQETEVIVRGCIAINGEEFVIERKLTRAKKRTKTSKASGTVQYFKVIDKFWDPEKPLEDYDPDTFDNKSGDVRNTNKVIKESLMKEDDFNLITTANAKTLDGLIDTGEAGLSKLFSRWIGLSVVEDKEVIAKSLFKEKSKNFLSNQHSTDQLQQTNIELNDNITNGREMLVKFNENLTSQNKAIVDLTKAKEALIASKGVVDEKIVKLDFETQEKRKAEIVEQGKNLRLQEKEFSDKVTELKDVIITVDKNVIEKNRQNITQTNDQHNKLISETKDYHNKLITNIKEGHSSNIANIKEKANNQILPLVSDIATIKATHAALKEENVKLDGSRVCPTCKRSYDADVLKNINDTIKSNSEKMEKLKQEGIVKNKNKEIIEKECTDTIAKAELEIKTRLEKAETDMKNIILQMEKEQKDTIDKLTKENQELIDKLELETKQIDERNRWELKLSQTRVEIQKSLNDYNEVDKLLKEYVANKETIQKNMELDIQVGNMNIRIKTEEEIKENIIKEISKVQNNIDICEKQVKVNTELIGKLYIENEYIKHHQLLISLLSKDGIKKLVLRNIIPLINSNLNNLLNDLTDFSVEIIIDEKNNVNFNIIKEDDNGEIESGNLKSASGFERTMSSLALRSTLVKYGAIPLIDFCVLDEITACVSPHNYHLLYELFQRFNDNYSTVFVISHSDDFNSFFEKMITVKKEKNVSRIIKNKI